MSVAEPSPPSGWTPPNIEAAGPPGKGSRYTGSSVAGTRPPPTALPEPQPVVDYGLRAHKPGVIPLRPLKTSDVISGTFSVLIGNVRIVALAWVAVWLPLLLLDLGCYLINKSSVVLVSSVAAVIGAVALTGLLAAPLHARALGHALSPRDALRVAGQRLGPLLVLDVLSAVVLAGPAILAALLAEKLADATRFGPLPLLQPLLFAVLLVPVLALALPLLLAQVVVVVEGQPLGRSLPRAFGLAGRSAAHLVWPVFVASLLLATLGWAVWALLGIWLPHFSGLLGAAIVSLLVPGFAVLAYLAARIRTEALDVELLAAEVAP
ncbi:MAG: hypothetical protein QM728_00210 [Gordonia sp. (in: high G+C Gram-positive bacteria)]|uniref:hypothetical protein n=1 Tax=Gordonia sp. (in: high G+C Gram-positive bacteria) TaxID=84139 RepID=UPI0039E3D6D6